MTRIKKIGCVIAYANNHNNYGTSLQGFATVKKIRDLGYHVEIIRYNKNFRFIQKLKMVYYMFRCGTYTGSLRRLKEEINKKLHRNYAKDIRVRTASVNTFKEKYIIPFFKAYNGYDSLKNGSLSYDLVLVGSDQLWLPISLYGKYYNLLFVEETVPKVSYASSFGVSFIPNFQREATGEYLNRFDRIGVRELHGKNIVESVSNKNATVVVDPTILMTRKEWEKVSDESKFNVSEPYIFCYFLGRNKKSREAVNQLKKKTKLKVITVRHMDEYISFDEKFGDEAPYDVSPSDFIKLISKAKYVCTDSFHGTVFSIIFNRKFMTFYRFRSKDKSSRNSRIDSLFELFDLFDRLYDGSNIFKIEKDINYSIVNMKIESLRDASLEFLKDSLSIAK
jgi:hypothetical protein